MKLSATVAAIEFEGDEVRVAVVKTGGKYPSVLELHAAHAAYHDAEQRIEVLTATTQELVKQVKAKPSAWVLCVSCEHGIVRNLTVPTRVRRRGASAIQFELEPYLAVPIDELIVDFNLVREANGESDVLAVGMRTGLLEQYVSILNAAGIEPEGIDVDAAGFTALWQAGRRLTTGLRAALHVRDTGSILVIMYQKAIAYFRHVPITAAEMRENPRAAARQAQNSIRAFLANWGNDAQIEELSVTGVDLFAEERQTFEDGVRVPVAYDDLLRNVKGKGLGQRDAVPSTVAADAAPAADDSYSAGGTLEGSAPTQEQAPTAPWESPVPSNGEAVESAPLPGELPLWEQPSAGAETESTTPQWPPAEAAIAPSATFAASEVEAIGTAGAQSVTGASGSTGFRANYWEATIGAATAAAGGAPSFNFRTGALAQKKTWGGIVRHMAFSAILTLVVLVSYSTYCYLGYRNNIAELDRIGGQVWDMYVEAFPDSPRAKEGRDPTDVGGDKTLAEMQEAVANLETGDDAELLEMLARPTLLDILGEIGKNLPPNTVTITELRIRKTQGEVQQVTISGNVEDPAAFNSALENLKKSTILKVSAEPTRAMKGGKETFAIAASL